MEIKDRVYGRFGVREPVLVELINSKPLQRLKRINQAGASQYAVKYKNVTRYEHSLGVMVLLARLNAPLKEQIAGLLHDVPHTAFSHVIDFVFKSSSHEFHERFHEKIIKNSEIPSILERFGFDCEEILDDQNFPLLEKKLPDLCADRIDYTLRDLVACYGFQERINDYLPNLAAVNNEIVFKKKQIAKDFAEDYLKIDEQQWSNPREVALFHVLADAIRTGLDEKIISEEDLFQEDAFVYEKLKQSRNPQILEKLGKINPNFKITDSPEDYDFHCKNKLRYVDPKFLNPDSSLSRVSEEFPEFKEKLANHKKLIERGNFVKIVSW